MIKQYLTELTVDMDGFITDVSDYTSMVSWKEMAQALKVSTEDLSDYDDDVYTRGTVYKKFILAKPELSIQEYISQIASALEKINTDLATQFVDDFGTINIHLVKITVFIVTLIKQLFF